MRSKTTKRIDRPLLISFGIGIIILLLFSAVLFTQASREKEKQINRVTHDYIQFQNRIENFFTSNINLMTGFSAYIQTFEQYDDQDVYTYLENLTRNNSAYINNVGIIQDTTIKWNYPMKGNEKSLGVDLSKVPDQAASVEYVKTTLNYHFDGPKQLIQGGNGYIIRMPLLKDNSYWGMVSVILRADKVQELFTEYAKECNLKVAIVNTSNGENLIFGDASIMQQNPLAFDSTFSGNQWTIYVVSSVREGYDWNYILLFSLLSLLIVSFIVRFTYNFFRKTERNNDILNREIFRDRLTMVHNRSYLDIRIHEEISLVNRYGSPLSIIYFDLDHFKKVNDRFGHSYGDAVLREIAQTVEANLRPSDVLARWGGEEFAVLMPFTGLKGAAAASEKIRGVVEAIDHPKVGQVTASFGVAEYVPDEYTGSWLKRVDKALYQSKEDGRNRVTAIAASKEDSNVQYRIKWCEEWNSGNIAIDMDHKELLRLVNHLVEDSYKFNSLGESIARYNELLNHLNAHIRREEVILEKAGYDGLEEHKESHRVLMKRIDAYRGQLVENSVEAQSLFAFIMDVVVKGHLVKEDTLFFKIF